MKLIEKNLYLGDVTSACNGQLLKSKSISHVLTVHLHPIPLLERVDTIQYKFITANDLPEVDLLQYFDECFDYINSAVENNGAVFVHCQFGISRSATIVIAYLMRKYSLPMSNALDRVKKCRPIVSPNYGFLHQLRLYEQMGWRLDSDNPRYRHFCLRALCNRTTWATGELDVGKFLVDVPENFQPNENKRCYKCRNCRYTLFTSECLLCHEVAEGSTGSEPGSMSDKCPDLYVTPLRWMEGSINEQEGKIYCPRCKAKLGQYKWSGLQCGCQYWVTPGFHMNPSKLDVC